MGTNTYDGYIIAWANEQARLLRAGQFSSLDIEHLAAMASPPPESQTAQPSNYFLAEAPAGEVKVKWDSLRGRWPFGQGLDGPSSLPWEEAKEILARDRRICRRYGRKPPPSGMPTRGWWKGGLRRARTWTACASGSEDNRFVTRFFEESFT